jgi:hypothetical protein
MGKLVCNLVFELAAPVPYLVAKHGNLSDVGLVAI